MQEYQTLWNQLAIFGGLRQTPFGRALQTGPTERLAAEIYALGGDFGLALRQLVLEDENACVRQPERFGEGLLWAQLQHELTLLNRLSGWTREAPPFWGSTPQNFLEIYPAFLGNLHKTGYGMFARHRMFLLEPEGLLRPLRLPDPQCLASLYGYARERQPVIDNTQVLLRGGRAQHVLLYGDAGTGKSSTVKAIVNEYAEEGLRLVEAPKSRLSALPVLLEALGGNPLKFIIFIDDLSFSQVDDHFSALKAVLEGGAGGCTPNCVIYATSNRRHLVKETKADRQGDEIHINDSLQEMLSLSARFGLAVPFQCPEKKEYLEIIRALAQERGLAICDAELIAEAERQALRRNGRSPRLAKQVLAALENKPI